LNASPVLNFIPKVQSDHLADSRYQRQWQEPFNERLSPHAIEIGMNLRTTYSTRQM